MAKFLAKHIILTADANFPIYEVVEGETLAEATLNLARRMQKNHPMRLVYDAVRGVVQIPNTTGAPHDGAILLNWPGD